jgi:homoprotocatechuate degradation regulator HpaR
MEKTAVRATKTYVRDEDLYGNNLPDTTQALGMSMLRAREALVSAIRPVLRAHDLTDQQWRILRVLSADLTSTPTNLARRTVILLPSLSRIVMDLEIRGLVSRFVPPSGGRAMMSITRKGRALVSTVYPKVLRKQKPIREGLGEENIRELLRLLHLIESIPL